MLKIFTFTFAVVLINYSVFAADIKLPLPDKSSKTTLIQALEKRQSDHAFSDKVIDKRTLSSILWAAYGVNRPDGKRTIPTAKNGKDLGVYVFNKDGIFLYDADMNMLKEHSNENYLDIFKTQDYMENVSTVLVYTGSQNDYALMHAGSAYQNVELFAAANNIGSIVRGYYDQEKVSKVLNLPIGHRPIISQAIGWKK